MPPTQPNELIPLPHPFTDAVMMQPDLLFEQRTFQREMSGELWDQINRAAKLDGMTFDEFCTLHMWAVAKERLHRELQRKRQAAEPKPDGRLRFPGGIR